MGSTPHARLRENDDFESEFAPLEPIPLKEVESLAVDEAQFVSLHSLHLTPQPLILILQLPFSCLNCVLSRVDCQPFGYGVQCSRCQTKRIKSCEHTLSSMELSNLFATIAKQNTFSLESKSSQFSSTTLTVSLLVTKYVVDDLKANIARAKRDYDSLRLSISAVEHSVCRTIEHARAATDVLGTDGLLSYFEAPKSSQDPNAVDLLNRLIENFNSMKAAPGDSIASVSPYSDFGSLIPLTPCTQTPAPVTAPDGEDDSLPGLSQVSPLFLLSLSFTTVANVLLF